MKTIIKTFYSLLAVSVIGYVTIICLYFIHTEYRDICILTFEQFTSAVGIAFFILVSILVIIPKETKSKPTPDIYDVSDMD